MQNKIIAVICVLLLLVTLFAACGKKVIIEGKNGQEYIAVTDDEGNTVLNNAGDIIVYVTDENGKYVKDANGERQTNAVTFPDQVRGEHAIATPQYRLTMPDDWKMSNDGKFLRNNNENVTFEIGGMVVLNETRTMSAYLQTQIDGMEYLKNNSEEFKNLTYEIKNAELTASQLPCTIIEMKNADDSGNLTMEQTLYYIQWGENMVQASYLCMDASSIGGFDSYTYLNENLEVKSLK